MNSKDNLLSAILQMGRPTVAAVAKIAALAGGGLLALEVLYGMGDVHR